MPSLYRNINEALEFKPSADARKRKRKTAEIKASGGKSGNIIRKVVNKIRAGESQLKHVLEHGYNIDQVIWAIKHRKCIANLGSTYLEQTISGTIQDLIKDGELRGHLINRYREIFGLPPMSKKDLKKKKGKGKRPTSALARKLSKAFRR